MVMSAGRQRMHPRPHRARTDSLNHEANGLSYRRVSTEERLSSISAVRFNLQLERPKAIIRLIITNKSTRLEESKSCLEIVLHIWH